MKEVVENKKKLYLFTIVFFVLISIILRIIPNSISNVLSYIIFPVYFFIITLAYWKNNRINENLPLILSIIYLIVGYICMDKVITPLKIIIAYLASLITNVVLKIKYKNKNKKLKKEEYKFTDDEKEMISNALPFLFVLLLEIYYSICTFERLSLSTNLFAILVEIILVYSIYNVLLFMFRHTSRTNIFFAVLFLIIFIINEGRIYYTSDTLLLTDVLFLQNAGEVAAFADVTFFNCINFLLFPTILTILLFIPLFKIAKKLDIKISNSKNTLIKSGISLVILLLLFIPNKNLDKFLINNVYNIYDGKDNAITASNTRYFSKYGVLSGMYGKLIEQNRIEPDNYSEKKLNRLLNSAEKNNGTWKKPNIIVVFSESFWDLSKLDKIKFDKDVTPNFHALAEKEKAIQMISPSYGGMSSNVEFEILTGGSLNYFSKGYTPYMQLFDRKTSTNNPSIIQEMKNNGYKTKILNSSSANMFNCDIVYDIYDVDERNHLYDEIDLGGEYVTDEYLTDKIIEYFDNKPKDEKIFYFAITMGGHMPYYEGRYKNYDVNIVESPYSKDVNEVVHSYAEGMYLADKQLGRLYDYINSIDEETIIVFFGDHLPHLATPDGKDALFTTNFLDNEYSLESIYKQYNTTALVMSNYDIDYGDVNYLSPDLLMTYVLSNMDLELSPFYKWLYSTKEVLPSSNYVVSQDKSGKIYYTLGLEKEMKEMYELRKQMQYYLFK